MTKRTKIGIVGCGAIGSYLATSIHNDFSNYMELSGLFDIENQKAVDLANNLGDKKLITLNLEELILRSHLVIEATSATSAYEIAYRSISFERNIMIMSTGGILDRFFELRQMAQEKKVKLLIPSGAICGLDGFKALVAGKIKIDKILLTTRKPISAFKGNTYILKKRINLDQIKEETLLFRGKVEDAVRFFPQNVNVYATVAIILEDISKTEVNIFASPHVQCNIHEIQVDSEAGRIFVRCENVTHPQNPKTSFLAVLSALATLKETFESFRIGT